MSRNGSGIFSLPGGSIVANGDTSDATDINTPLNDIAADLNIARPIVAGGTGATSATAARTALGVVIGTDVQANNANLTSLAGLTLEADKGLYATAANTVAMFDLTAAGIALSGGANAAAQRATLGVAPAASPTFTGVPASPTAAAGTNTTQIATTAFVQDVAAGSGSPSSQTADLPNGTSLRSGNGTANGAVTVTFPAAFPTACRQVVACHSGIGGAFAVVTGQTTTGFQVRVFNDAGSLINADYTYIAIGY